MTKELHVYAEIVMQTSSDKLQPSNLDVIYETKSY